MIRPGREQEVPARESKEGGTVLPLLQLYVMNEGKRQLGSSKDVAGIGRVLPHSESAGDAG